MLQHREFTDPEQLAAALPAGSGGYKLLGRGVFRAQLTVVELGRVTLQCARESLARVAHHAMLRAQSKPRSPSWTLDESPIESSLYGDAGSTSLKSSK